MTKLSVIIPAWNEAETIEELVDKVLSVPLEKEIIIVDNGSTDGTAEKLEKVKAKVKKDLKVIFLPKNAGKGGGVREAFKHVTGDYVIIQDADLEYEPNEYLKLVEALDKGKGDVIYGSRFKGDVKKIMKSHLYGNKFFTFLNNLLYGTNLTDMETCYKLFPADFAKKIRIESAGFGFEPEITSKILRAGYKIYEVPITYKGRTFEEGKKINWKHGLETIWVIFRFRFFKK